MRQAGAAPLVFEQGGTACEQGIGTIRLGRRLFEANEVGTAMGPVAFVGRPALVENLSDLALKAHGLNVLKESLSDRVVKASQV